MNELIILTELATRLREAGFAAVPSYAKLYEAVLDGELVGLVEKARGRWHIRRADLEAVAKRLHLPRVA